MPNYKKLKVPAHNVVEILREALEKSGVFPDNDPSLHRVSYYKDQVWDEHNEPYLDRQGNAVILIDIDKPDEEVATGTTFKITSEWLQRKIAGEPEGSYDVTAGSLSPKLSLEE